ncbi:hypothetical protein OG474_21895 [Kribbella sp. NBC_01505]|uniref:hypothetical protein n=1 Tax=Kribbella sp. NBC_01505 TaxID=2903580 RepID=UPI003865A594
MNNKTAAVRAGVGAGLLAVLTVAAVLAPTAAIAGNGDKKVEIIKAAGDKKVEVIK